MLKKLDKAIKELNERTGAVFAIEDYDELYKGKQMTISRNGDKYFLWLYTTPFIDKRGVKQQMGVGNCGRVVGKFRTQVEAVDRINSKEFDNFIL